MNQIEILDSSFQEKIDSIHEIDKSMKLVFNRKIDSLKIEKGKFSEETQMQEIFSLATIRTKLIQKHNIQKQRVETELYKLKYAFNKRLRFLQQKIDEESAKFIIKPATLTEEEIKEQQKRLEIEKKKLIRLKKLKDKGKKLKTKRKKEKLKRILKALKKKKKLSIKGKTKLEVAKSELKDINKKRKQDIAKRKKEREAKKSSEIKKDDIPETGVLKEKITTIDSVLNQPKEFIDTIKIVINEDSILNQNDLVDTTAKNISVDSTSFVKHILNEASIKVGFSKEKIKENNIEYKITEQILKDTINIDNLNVAEVNVSLDSLYKNLDLSENTLSDLKKMEIARQKAIQEKFRILQIEQTISNEEVVFETNVDTLKISQKEKEAFTNDDKKGTGNIAVLDTFSTTDTTIKIIRKVPVVNIKEKKKKKYSFGDVVDYNHSEKARFYLLRAKKEIDQGNISKAKEFIGTSLKLNPSYVDAFVLLGDIYASLNFFDKAIKNYSFASKLDTTNAQMLYNIGNCFIKLGSEKNAIAVWSKAIHVDSTYILAYAGRASLFLNKKEYRKAIIDYNKIFELNKYFYPAYRGRGVAYFELGEFTKSINDFNNFLEYEPNDAFTITKRGISKLYDNDIFGGCTDMLNASEMGYEPARVALKKHCEK